MVRMIVIATVVFVLTLSSSTLSFAKKGGGGGGHSGSDSSHSRSHGMHDKDSGLHVQNLRGEYVENSDQNQSGHSGMVFNDEGRHHHGHGMFGHNHGDGNELNGHGELESGRHGVGEIEIHHGSDHD